jgi:hypothetical protein
MCARIAQFLRMANTSYSPWNLSVRKDIKDKTDAFCKPKRGLSPSGLVEKLLVKHLRANGVVIKDAE